MSDKVLFQTDDALSEVNLAKRRARANSTDYVERGLEVTPDWKNAEIDLSGGHAVVSESGRAYDVFVDSRSGLSLADSEGMNYVFLIVGLSSQDDVQIRINADGSAPSDPSLLIAEVDADTEAISLLKRNPDGEYRTLRAGTFRADAQPGVADTFVTSTEELEAAFDNLSEGETVRIAQSDAPYRPEQWLDIDTSYVTVVAESQFARDGKPLVKPADGSNVGGIRVGHNSETEHVRVEGLGFHGNEANMSDSAKRLHGFVADQNASHVTFRDNAVARTNPYHEHASGGSGFTVRKGATHVELVDNLADAVGDHGIQVAGTHVLVRGNTLTNGFGHSIALDVTESDGSYIAKNVSVVNNFGRNNEKGSFVGFEGNPQRSGRGYFSIVGNVATGQHRKLAQLGNSDMDVEAVSVVSNVGRNGSHSGIMSTVGDGDSRVTISNNVLAGYSNGGIRINRGDNVSITNNVVASVGRPGTSHRDGIKATGGSNHNISGNIVYDSGGVGITVQNKATATTVAQNRVWSCEKQGILIDQEAVSSSEQGALVCGNALDGNSTATTLPELDVKTGNVLGFGNHVTTRKGSTSFSDAGSGNLWVGNMAPADGSAWSLGSATGVRTMANRPNPAGKGFVVTSSDGTRYEVSVANDGTLTITSL